MFFTFIAIAFTTGEGLPDHIKRATGDTVAE